MRDVLIGQTDYTVIVGIFGADGAPETGLAHTDIDIDYARVETDNDVTTTDASPASLSALTDAHSDWGWYEIGQGLYRLDIADAVFASGAWEAVVTVSDASGTDFQPVHVGFRLINPPATKSDEAILRISKSGIATYHYSSADTDAARGTALIAAQTAAAAGDSIFVSAHCLCTSALGKDGVTYYLSNGAIISNATTAVVAAASAMEFSVIGDGVLSGSANSTPTVSLTHASAIVNVRVRDVLASGSGSAGLKTTAGVLNAEIAEDIRSTLYDGIWNAGGTINATAIRIVAGDDGIELGAGHTNVRCREIVAGSNGTPVFGTGAAGTTYTIYADRAYKSSYVTNNAVTISEGQKGFIEIGYIVGAVEWNGGDVILANSVIDSSALAAPTVVMQGADGKFAFHNVTLVTKSDQTCSIYTEITEFQQAIELSGAVNMNKAVHADVDVYYSAIDWSRISNKTTTQNLSGTTIKDASDVPTAAENAAAVAAQADIAGMIAAVESLVNFGTGARTVTITVNDGSTALQGAYVRYSQAGNTTHFAQTNASGQVTFNCDDGTYTVAISKSGYSFSGTTQVVDGNETPTYSMTATVVTTPSSPELCVVTGYTRKADGSADPSVEVKFKMRTAGGSGGSVYSDATVSATSNGSGLFSIELPKNSQFDVSVDGSGAHGRYATGDDDNQTIDDIVL